MRNTFENFCSQSEVLKLYFIESWHLETFGQAWLYICVRSIIFCNLGLSKSIISANRSFVLFCYLLFFCIVYFSPPIRCPLLLCTFPCHSLLIIPLSMTSEHFAYTSVQPLPWYVVIQLFRKDTHRTCLYLYDTPCCSRLQLSISVTGL